MFPGQVWLSNGPGDTDPEADEDIQGTMRDIPAEPIESDLELQLHVLGFKAIYSQFWT